MINNKLQKALRRMWDNNEITGIPNAWSFENFIDYIQSPGMESFKHLMKIDKADSKPSEEEVEEEEEEGETSTYSKKEPEWAKHFARSIATLAQMMKENPELFRRKKKPKKVPEGEEIFSEEEKALFASGRNVIALNDSKEDEDEKEEESDYSVRESSKKPELHSEEEDEEKKMQAPGQLVSGSNAQATFQEDEEEEEKEPKKSRKISVLEGLQIDKDTLETLSLGEKQNLVGSFVKRDKRDLTRHSGTRRFKEKQLASGRKSSIMGLAPVQRNLDLQQKIWKPIQEAQKREKKIAERKLELVLLPDRVKGLAKTLMSKPFHRWTGEELNQAKKTFGKSLDKIIRANELRYGDGT